MHTHTEHARNGCRALRRKNGMFWLGFSFSIFVTAGVIGHSYAQGRGRRTWPDRWACECPITRQPLQRWKMKNSYPPCFDVNALSRRNFSFVVWKEMPGRVLS